MKLIAVLAASSIGVAAFAQNTVSTETTATAGLLGGRYVATGFGWTDINHSSREGMGAGLALNVPVNANFDVTVAYGYSWLEGVIGVGHSVDTAVTGYIARGENKYFASASLGYNWAENLFDTDHPVWGLSAGIERAVSDKLSLTTSVGYADDFGQHRDSRWDVSVGAAYNLTSKLVATADVALIEGGSVAYTAGIAFRF